MWFFIWQDFGESQPDMNGGKLASCLAKILQTLHLDGCSGKPPARAPPLLYKQVKSSMWKVNGMWFSVWQVFGETQTWMEENWQGCLTSDSADALSWWMFHWTTSNVSFWNRKTALGEKLMWCGSPPDRFLASHRHEWRKISKSCLASDSADATSWWMFWWTTC